MKQQKYCTYIRIIIYTFIRKSIQKKQYCEQLAARGHIQKQQPEQEDDH